MIWYKPKAIPDLRMNETVKIPNLSRLYSGRCLLPARHTDLKVRVLNADSKERTIKKGTGLGSVSPLTALDVVPGEKKTVAGLGPAGLVAPVKSPDENRRGC